MAEQNLDNEQLDGTSPSFENRKRVDDKNRNNNNNNLLMKAGKRASKILQIIKAR